MIALFSCICSKVSLAIGLTAAAVLFSGCWEQRFVWAPNGARATVLARDGLRLCTAEGQLTAPLLSDVYEAAWFSDSTRLVLSRERTGNEWSQVARLLGPQRAARIEAKAAAKWAEIEKAPPAKFERLDAEDDRLVRFYLWKHRGDWLRKRYGAEADDSAEFGTHELFLARVDAETLMLGSLLHEGVEPFKHIRVAPTDRAVAYVTTHSADLYVNLPQAIAPRLVTASMAGGCAWTADGRSLVYAYCGGANGRNNDAELGVIVRREVLDEKGNVAIAKEGTEIAGLIYSSSTRIWCLRDGRMLFNAAEMEFPVGIRDVNSPRESLFMIDPTPQAPLVRVAPRGIEREMPAKILSYHLSPDEKNMLVTGKEGEVCILALASGQLEKVQRAGDYNLKAAAVWRSASEITFAKRTPLENNKRPARTAEIVLRSLGGDETVLSSKWTTDTLKSMFESIERTD